MIRFFEIALADSRILHVDLAKLSGILVEPDICGRPGFHTLKFTIEGKYHEIGIGPENFKKLMQEFQYMNENWNSTK